MFELTEIMRQKDDAQFAELLNRIREGKHTEEDLSLLKTRSHFLRGCQLSNNEKMNFISFHATPLLMLITQIYTMKQKQRKLRSNVLT